MKSGTTLSEHERTFDELVQSLAQIGKTIDTDELIVLYAASLPNETFGNWVQSQMAFIDNLSISDFKGRVREEARRLNLAGLATNLGVSDSNIMQANNAARGAAGICCNYCGYRGHIKSQCHKRIAEEYNAKHANQNQKFEGNRGRGRGRGRGHGRGRGTFGSVSYGESSNDGQAFSAIFGGFAYCYKAAANISVRKANGVWIKDSGATHHMHYDRTMFKEYTRLKHKLFIGGIKGGLHAVGVGTVSIMDKNGHVCTLQKVLHVPHLKTGLMSLTQLALAGYTITIDGKGCTVSNEKFSIHSAIENGLCWWVPNATSDTVAFFAEAFNSKVASLEDWHQRLAHVSKDTLVKFGDNTFADVRISECGGNHGSTQHCSSCEVGKHHRLPFHSIPKEKRRSKPLELVHSDLCECHVTSLGDGRYVLTFTDNCTRHCRVYILPNKSSSMVLTAFKEYQAWVERQSGHKIKELRADRGTEYMDEMAEYIKSLGIEHNVTAAYSPQSNSVAEKINCTLFDMVCPMLDSSGTLLELWSEALHTACYIRNRLPSRSLDGKSPHEAWTGTKPNVGHIRKFGSLVYCHIPKKSGRKKLEGKALRTYLVGYQSHGIYRVYHPETKSIRITRDLKIHETEFINARHTVKSSRLFNPDNEEATPQSEVTSAPVLEDSITVMPPNTAPMPAEATNTNTNTARPRQTRLNH